MSEAIVAFYGEGNSKKNKIVRSLCMLKKEGFDAGYILPRQAKCISSCKMSIVNLPECDAEDDKVEKSYLIKVGINEQDIHYICVVLDYQIGDMTGTKIYKKFMERVSCISSLLQKSTDRFMVLITLDNCNRRNRPDQTTQDTIRDHFKENGINKLFFYDQSHHLAKDLAYDIHKITRSEEVKQEKLEINDQEFMKGFELYDEKARAEMHHCGILKDLSTLINNHYMITILNKIQSEPNQNIRDELCISAIAQSKADCHEILDKHSHMFKDYMVNFNDYSTYIHIQMFMHNLLEKFRKHVVANVMSYDPNDQTDIRNLVRRCPHCGEAWIKVEGCDGQTNCGAKPESIKSNVVTKGAQSKGFVIQDGQVTITAPKQGKKGVTKKHESELEPGCQVKYKGCGKPFVWKDAQRLSRQEIEAIFSTSDIDAVVRSLLGEKDEGRPYSQQPKKTELAKENQKMNMWAVRVYEMMQ